MSARIAWIAALPREVAPLVRGWEQATVAEGVTLYERREALVVCAGMGAVRAARAVEAALARGPVRELVSIGIAGACDAALRTGDVLEASAVVDTHTGERFLADGVRTDLPQCVIATVAGVAGAAEKQRLSASYSAALVDMEAAAVARLAAAHGVRFSAIKAVSDEATFALPDLSRFVTHTGQMREAAFALHAMVRPAMWKPLIQLAKNSKLAIANLAAAVERRMDSAD